MISNSEAITIRKFDIALDNQSAGAIKDLIVQLKDKSRTEETETYTNFQRWQDIYYRINTLSYISEEDKSVAGSVIGAIVEKAGKKRFAMHLLKLTILAQENYTFSDFTASLSDKTILEPDVQSIPALWKYLHRSRENFLKSRLDSNFLDLSAAVYKFLKYREERNQEFFMPIYAMLASLDIEYDLVYLSPDDAVSVFRNNIEKVGKTKLSITRLNGSLYWLECPKCGDIEKRFYGVASHYCEACGGVTYPYVQDTGSLIWQKNYAVSLFKAYRSPNILLLYPNKENIQNLLPFIEESEYGDDQYLAIVTTKDDMGWIKDALGHIRYNIYTQNNISELTEEIRLRCLSVHSVDYLQTR